MRNEISLQRLATQETITGCPDCGSLDAANDKDERYCTRCGYVFE